VWRYRIIVLLLAVSTASAQEADLGKVLVGRRWANVRTGPTTSSSVLRKVYEGEAFDILEVKDEWVRVKIDEQSSGWIFHDLVHLEGPSAPQVMPHQEATVPASSPDWLFASLVIVFGIGGAVFIYWWLSRRQRLFDFEGRLDRMTSAAYIDSVSRDDVVRLTKAFGIGDRAARAIARQTYLDRYKVSSSHQKLTEKEKGSFRRLQAVLALGDEDVMRIMAKVYKRRPRGERVEA